MLRVQFERLEKRMTLAEAARAIGITRGDLSRLESGQLRPSAKHQTALCTYYALPAEALWADVTLAETPHTD